MKSTLMNKAAPLILAEIQKAKSILLHCHPAPDPDSVGGALAMKFALEQMGKKVTVIKGDSIFPRGFEHFPGAADIVRKNFLEIDLAQYDLFIVLDSARIEMVTRRGEVKFPETLKVIAIDHHQTNDMYGSLNLVDPSYPANCLILYDLFEEWGVKLTSEIATNLFIGIYTDTGAFKYAGAMTSRTLDVAARLTSHIPNVQELIGKMVNSNTAEFIAYEGEALRSIEVFFGRFAISAVPRSFLEENKIPTSDVRTSEVSTFMLSVAEWDFVAAAVEIEPGLTKFSFRSKDADKFDVAKITSSLGGGGHRAAAGLSLNMHLEEAKAAVVMKVKELYNL